MLCGCSKIIVKPGGKVITIEPSADASSVEEVVKVFSMAFVQVCALKVVDVLVVDGLTVGWRGFRRLFFGVQLIHFPKELCLQ